MLSLSVLGNIGGNAELREENGNKFVTFKVAHNERYTNQQGIETEKTMWVSCVLNGDGGNLFPYLVRGQQVYVSGDADVRVYHSAAAHSLVAGINLRVRSIQLVGARPDAVPSVLFDEQGREVRVVKYYHTDMVTNAQVTTRDGRQFKVDDKGWVFEDRTDQQPAETEKKDPNDGEPFL